MFHIETQQSTCMVIVLVLTCKTSAEILVLWKQIKTLVNNHTENVTVRAGRDSIAKVANSNASRGHAGN